MDISEFLRSQRVAFEFLRHPPAFSATMRAKYLHVPGRQVAKSVLLRGPDGFLIAVLPATHQVDTDALADVLGGPVRLADDGEITAIFRDCEWGVVPPFAALYGLRTILDESISHDVVLVFEAQTHVEAIRMRCADFVRLERPRRIGFARKVQPQLN
jgi:Ala-tRNA(Pro) deacylase